MQHDQHQYGQWYGDDVQGKKAVECGIGDDKIAPNPCGQVFTHKRDGPEQ